MPPSAALVAAAARVLGVRPADLYGADEREIAEKPPPELGDIRSLRSALDAYDDPEPVGDPLDLATARRRLQSIGHKLVGLRYAHAADELPPLLHHIYVLADQPGHAGEQGRAALHDAYRMAATLAGRFRQGDLAAVASERHVQLAPRTNDPLRVAISAYRPDTFSTVTTALVCASGTRP